MSQNYAQGAHYDDQKEPRMEMPVDTWQHRSRDMRCATCMWFVAKHSVVGRLGDVVGRCRRHAPTMSGYPVVYDTDWCGDHKLDENK